MPKDLLLLINELGSVNAAIRYCERIEAVNGPLAGLYADYAARLRAACTCPPPTASNTGAPNCPLHGA